MNYNIAEWLKDYLGRSGANGFVIGLSGGVDSTVVAALAVEAIGPERVIGVCMPCHSDVEDKALAKQVSEWLGITLLEMDLSTIYDIFEISVPTLVSSNGMATFNVKARLRMTALYRIANAYNYLVLGTGCKSEIEVGYFTKYGDGGVDLLPIGDLYKTEVRTLARALGAPARVTERPSSAGLWPGQTDEEEMGITYADLDEMLAGLQPKSQKVKDMIAAAAHKMTMPPICIMPEEK